MPIKLEKIVIRINDKTIELTPAEAKALHNELGRICKKEKEYVYIPIEKYFPNYPIYVDNTGTPPPPWKITCQDNTVCMELK